MRIKEATFSIPCNAIKGILLGSKFGHITMQSNHVVRMSVPVYGDPCA